MESTRDSGGRCQRHLSRPNRNRPSSRSELGFGWRAGRRPPAPLRWVASSKQAIASDGVRSAVGSVGGCRLTTNAPRRSPPKSPRYQALMHASGLVELGAGALLGEANLTVMDVFPMTSHVEVVAQLVRSDDGVR